MDLRNPLGPVRCSVSLESQSPVQKILRDREMVCDGALGFETENSVHPVLQMRPLGTSAGQAGGKFNEERPDNKH
jgi:hypothetical protein